MRKIVSVFVVLMVLSMSLSACAPDGANCPSGVKGISITDLWMRPSGSTSSTTSTGMATPMNATPASGMSMASGSSAAYMVINNCSSDPDKLLSVESDVAAIIEMHKSETRNGVTMMSAQPNIEIPAGKQVILKPGDLHVMFMKLAREVKVGDTVSLTLVFEKAGQMTLQATVKSQ